MVLETATIDTPAGTIRVLDTGGAEPAVVFIHGNSGCAELFRGLLSEQYLHGYRGIALDLPGHGASGRSSNPERDYSVPGLATWLTDLLTRLELGAHALVGHSLGGHVVSAAIPQLKTTAALMLVSAPPINAATMGEAFLPDPTGGAMFGAELTGVEQRRFLDAVLPASGGAREASRSMLLGAIASADVRFRPALLASIIAGRIDDERARAEQSELPTCLVFGRGDPFLRVEYARGLKLKLPFSGGVHVFEHSGHSPHLDAPEQFGALLRRFLDATLLRKAAVGA